ncbi:Lunapark b isoform 1 [Mycena indigotica]|uniref:Endoplasmic reticulum junction formation protein lunapark n=1 Tax=Mycena indigotica TaxID=2126181 RepID=A0A8H6W514_9AGAR|nr:Lunapark b isoform 1 [Mycena indigotica]KAF7299484.1 Lunapark b isoform 1 [Mycena indigotica]
MSFLLRLFRSSKPASDDYETVLATLASNIQKRQQQLADIRQRERRATTLVTLYTLAGWLVYLGSWYFGFVNGGGRARVTTPERVVRALPVFVGPILILFIRRIVQLWYNRKGNQEGTLSRAILLFDAHMGGTPEKSLQVLMKEQREKVEEIKKKTNFYSTRDLLSRYDQQSAPGTPQKPPPSTVPTQQRGPGPRVPPQQKQPTHLSATTASNPPQQPPQPHRRTLFDSVADLLVGAEDVAPASQRFALICEKCFAHNGLVHEAAWPDAQYVCPKCGHFNPSARSRKVIERASPLSSPSSGAGQLPPDTGSISTAMKVGNGDGSLKARKRTEGTRKPIPRLDEGEEGERMDVDGDE